MYNICQIEVFVNQAISNQFRLAGLQNLNASQQKEFIMNKFLKFLTAIAVAVMFSACNGGGPGPTPPAPPTTHTISGVAISGATLSLGGAASATTTAAADGTYSFTNVANGSYTITPTLPGYTFTPTSQAVTVNGADVSVPAFIATANPAPTYSISGAVSGLGAGVTIGLSPGGASTTTNASGGFTFAGLANGSYTVTPMYPGYTFTPASALAVVNGADVSVPLFVATANPAPTHSISGTASAGATLNLSGSAIANTTAAVDGTYSFPNVANGNYTITPTLTGFTFTPTSQAVVVNGADVSVPAFTATANPVPTHSISGAVTGDVLGGVTITATPGGATASTDASGNYILSGLVDGGYTITPSLTGKTFNPTSASATVSGANVTGVNFAEVIPVTTKKILYAGFDPALVIANGGDGALYTKDFSSNVEDRLWGGYQHFPNGYAYAFPFTMVPSRVGGMVVFNGSNIPCLAIMSLSVRDPYCAIPIASNVPVKGSYDATPTADAVVIAQGFTGPPYKQNIMVYVTDTQVPSVPSPASVRVSDGDVIDSSPVFASSATKLSTAVDVLFVRNDTDALMQTVNLVTGLPVGAPTVFASNIVNGVRAFAVNADFTKVAYMKSVGGSTHIFIKPKAGGAETDLAEGTDPFWATDGSDLIMYTVNGARMAIKSDGTGKVQVPSPANLSINDYTVALCGNYCAGNRWGIGNIFFIP